MAQNLCYVCTWFSNKNLKNFVTHRSKLVKMYFEERKEKKPNFSIFCSLAYFSHLQWPRKWLHPNVIFHLGKLLDTSAVPDFSVKNEVFSKILKKPSIVQKWRIVPLVFIDKEKLKIQCPWYNPSHVENRKSCPDNIEAQKN